TLNLTVQPGNASSECSLYFVHLQYSSNRPSSAVETFRIEPRVQSVFVNEPVTLRAIVTVTDAFYLPCTVENPLPVPGREIEFEIDHGLNWVYEDDEYTIYTNEFGGSTFSYIGSKAGEAVMEVSDQFRDIDKYVRFIWNHR